MSDQKTIKIASLNVNGLRACVRNGFWDWFHKEQPDILCMQEVRMSLEQIAEKKNIKMHSPPEGYTLVQSDADKKGYSGVSIWSRKEILESFDSISIEGMEWANSEGRCVGIRLKDFDVEVWSMYFPSGTSGEVRQSYKDDFLKKIQPWMSQKITSKVLLCGDFNIAHTALDLFHDKANRKKAGYLPHERDWMTDRIKEGWVDVWRTHHPEIERYSWWSNRSKTARQKNVGWRIDYQLATPSLASFVKTTEIQGPLPKISDHAPVLVTFQLDNPS
jgi:exodeoxyribonuclease III